MMRGSILVFIFIVCACDFSYAQTNYVLNPSFESYSTCPTFETEIWVANYWSNADSISTYQCGPSYLNECASPTSGVSVPGGGGGGGLYYHYPRTGKGMVFTGFYADATASIYPYVRTYVQGRLYKTLTAGKTYCVTFYVAIALGSSYAVNHIAAYFDNGAIDSDIISQRGCFLTVSCVPQIVEDSIIADTEGFDIPLGGSLIVPPPDSPVYERSWVKVQGTFIATGNESFFTIANFDPIALTDTVRLQTAAGGACYLLDDVSVVESDAVADAGPDVVIHPGDSTLIGNDTAAVGGGDGMPCWWYIQGNTNAIDSGGRILVHPDTTTTYVMMMDLCGNITYDTVTVNVWPAGITSPAMQRGIFNVVIAPNPAKDQIAVNGINNKIGYKLTNILGMPLAIGILQPGHTNIDLSGYPSGSYLLELEDPDTGTKIVRRVVKE